MAIDGKFTTMDTGHPFRRTRRAVAENTIDALFEIIGDLISMDPILKDESKERCKVNNAEHISRIMNRGDTGYKYVYSERGGGASVNLSWKKNMECFARKGHFKFDKQCPKFKATMQNLKNKNKHKASWT
ncbi:unnamed protein product [Ambrosiozyma monospora]|uniref:Unnamed protein product n=1 Tax=Ambrosiozyma monospora TaxID=43982 RepID=A0A9W7DHQ9_AMBMO|nr:unnamed protein product [Ambrosiozyma monospora]